jgi:hypothetical protein
MFNKATSVHPHQGDHMVRHRALAIGVSLAAKKISMTR